MPLSSNSTVLMSPAIHADTKGDVGQKKSSDGSDGSENTSPCDGAGVLHVTKGSGADI
jgi:hypothetical protein